MANGELGPKSMPEQSNDYRVAVFGAGGVGKSSIVQRFVKGTFSESYVPTIEDTYRQVISCNKQQNVCTLQITDTTGSHQFPAMQRLSISRGHAFLLVYAIDKADTFRSLFPIYNEIQAIKGAGIDDTPIMLVGNKKDETARKVKAEIGEAQAKSWGVGFIETSAKLDVNITELFQSLLALEKRRNLTLSTEEELKGKKGKKKREKAEKKAAKSLDKDNSEKSKEKKSKKESKKEEKAAASEDNDETGATSERTKGKCSMM